jgi:DNA-directed RNA polymerase subunit E'/Rpb7
MSLNTNILVKDYLFENYLYKLSSDGYIKEIKNIDNVDLGEILQNGKILYNVHFDAIVYKLKENDIIDAIVKSVTSFGLYCVNKYAPENVTSLFVPGEQNYIESQDIKLKIKALRIKQNEYLCVCSIID